MIVIFLVPVAGAQARMFLARVILAWFLAWKHMRTKETSRGPCRELQQRKSSTLSGALCARLRYESPLTGVKRSKEMVELPSPLLPTCPLVRLGGRSAIFKNQPD